MKITTNLFEIGRTGRTFLDLDSDMFMRLVNPMRTYRHFNKHYKVRNKKGVLIPVWRIVRKCFNKGFDVKYRDGDPTNLKRENLLLVRRSK